ncbi:hypothetical protein AAY473_007602 [Plecturocebus cupreus]
MIQSLTLSSRLERSDVILAHCKLCLPEIHSETWAAHRPGECCLPENHPELQTQATAQSSSPGQTGALLAQTRVEIWNNTEKACEKELPVPQREELKVGMGIRLDRPLPHKIQQLESFPWESFTVNTSSNREQRAQQSERSHHWVGGANPTSTETGQRINSSLAETKAAQEHLQGRQWTDCLKWHTDTCVYKKESLIQEK